MNITNTQSIGADSAPSSTPLFALLRSLLNKHHTMAADDYREGVSDRVLKKHYDEYMSTKNAFVSALSELESQHREMRTLLLRIHSARVGMNEAAVIAALNDVDSFFREPNTN